jgi:TonB family protein
MRVQKAFCVFVGLVICLADSGLAADCSHPQSTASTSTHSQDSVWRNVIVQVRVNSAGEVRDANVVSGSETLRSLAIDAVKARKYKFARKSGATRKVKLVVAFDQTSDTVTEIAQLVLLDVLIGGVVHADTLADIKHLVEPGASGCTVAPLIAQVPEDEMQSRLLNRTDPVYPRKAKARRIDGTVDLQIWIDEQGNVYATRTLSGPDTLAPAAADAVKKWKYQPFMFNGEPVKAATTVHVTFEL